MDLLNSGSGSVNTKPKAEGEGGGELLQTEMDIDLPDIKQEFLEEYSMGFEHIAESVTVKIEPKTEAEGGGELRLTDIDANLPDVEKQYLEHPTGAALTPATHPRESHGELDCNSGKLKRKRNQTYFSKSSDITAVNRTINQSDIIDYLLNVTPFSDLPITERLQIIADGRPTPDLKIINDKQKSYTRTFKLSTYTKYSWMAGSLKLSGMFCWPCLLLSSTINVWNSTGYNDLSHYTVAAVSHEQKQAHYHAVLALSNFGSDRIETNRSTQRSNQILLHNEKVEQKRRVFRRLVDVTCFLAKQEIPFLRQNNSIISANRGNFLEFVKLVSQFDSILGNHLQSDHTSIFKFVSDNKLKNDIVNAISCVVINKIQCEINNSDFVALIVEESPVVGGSDQLCFILRYLTGATVTERFLGFIDVSADRRIENITELIINKLKEYNCSTKLIAQAYDAAGALCGSTSELQTKVKLLCPDAMSVWCGANVLNLVLSKSCERIPETRKFFHVVKSIANFFQASTKRTEFYNQLCDSRMARVAATRWGYNSQTINVIASERLNLIELFESIIDLPDDWDGETIRLSESFLFSLRNFEFMFFLQIYEQIFERTDKLSKIINKGTADTGSCIGEIKKFECFIKDFSFDSNYTSAVSLTREPKIKINIADIKVHYQRIFQAIKDNILSEIKERYKSLKELTFLELLESGFFSKFSQTFPSQQLSKLKSLFPLSFEFGRLKNELMCVYSSLEFAEKKPLEILKLCVGDSLKDAFPQLIRLASLLVTIPARSASGKGSFSALKRIDAYLRNTQNPKRISDFSIITIEKELLTSLRSSGTFYDDVISEFLKREKRIQLAYALGSSHK